MLTSHLLGKMYLTSLMSRSSILNLSLEKCLRMSEALANVQALLRPWDVLIVDEGHQIKNPSCQSGRSLRRISASSRILLTGQEAQLARRVREYFSKDVILWRSIAKPYLWLEHGSLANIRKFLASEDATSEQAQRFVGVDGFCIHLGMTDVRPMQTNCKL